MKRGLVSVALAAAFALPIAFGSVGTVAQDTSEDRIAALETRMAALETQVAGGGGAATTPEASPVAVGPSDMNYGTALEILPKAEAGKIQVVATGIYDGYSLPVIVHNNSGVDVQDLKINVVARDATNAMVGVGSGGSDATPYMIPNGTYAMATVSFSGAVLPEFAVYESDASGTDASTVDPSYTYYHDLVINEANMLAGSFIGVLTNPTELALTYGTIAVACLDAQGVITGYTTGSTNVSALPPGKQVPFQVTFYTPPTSCEYYIAASYGS